MPTLRAEFGVVMEKCQRELQEVACIELHEIQPDRQQVISIRSFGSMVTELPVLQPAVDIKAIKVSYAAVVAGRRASPFLGSPQ